MHILNILHIFSVQTAFNPEGIQFKTLPTMSAHIVDAMLPDDQGKINKLSLHEGILNLH